MSGSDSLSQEVFGVINATVIWLTTVRSAALVDIATAIGPKETKRPIDMAGFTGKYDLVPVGPTLFEYYADDQDPRVYTSSDGLVIQPETMITDGASVPRIFWWKKWLGPVDWLDAAVIHDWMFEEHHRGIKEWSFTDANRIMREAMYYCGVPWLWRWVVWLAVTLFGYPVWINKGMVPEGGGDAF